VCFVNLFVCGTRALRVPRTSGPNVTAELNDDTTWCTPRFSLRLGAADQLKSCFDSFAADARSNNMQALAQIAARQALRIEMRRLPFELLRRPPSAIHERNSPPRFAPFWCGKGSPRESCRPSCPPLGVSRPSPASRSLSVACEPTPKTSRRGSSLEILLATSTKTRGTLCGQRGFPRLREKLRCHRGCATDHQGARAATL
jgi:hypothetical protein